MIGPIDEGPAAMLGVSGAAPNILSGSLVQLSGGHRTWRPSPLAATPLASAPPLYCLQTAADGGCRSGHLVRCHFRPARLTRSGITKRSNTLVAGRRSEYRLT